MKSSDRQERVAYSIQCALEEAMRYKMADPRLKFINITRVKVSSDLSHATIFLIASEDNMDITALLNVLKKAVGKLRCEIAKYVKLRVIPALRFSHDTSLLKARRLNQLIEQVVITD